MMRIIAAIALLFAAAPPQEKEKVDTTKVNEAIKKGADYLLKEFADRIDTTSWVAPIEIVVLTLHHCNVKADDPTFKKLLDKMMGVKLEYTYRVALFAMALQRLGPEIVGKEKYEEKLAHCAQWLVDTQCAEGEWGYPGTLHDPKTHPKAATTEPPKKEPLKKGEPPVWRIVRKLRPGKEKGDMSNAQFALFGLRACQEGGIDIPKETWAGALKFLLYTQRPDGGWGYYFNDRKDKASYGSLTLAGIAAVAVCRYNLGMKEPLKDASISRGIVWFARCMDFAENPGVTSSNVIDPQAWHYYYLYSIERAGIILGTEKFGPREWYPGGATWIVRNQRSDGSWATGKTMDWKAAGDMGTGDTCLALLFLTRSTPPLVATGGKEKEKEKDKEK